MKLLPNILLLTATHCHERSMELAAMAAMDLEMKGIHHAA